MQKGDVFMNRFAITITNGDNREVVKTFYNKDDAMKFGNDFVINTPSKSGTISCISADFDDSDNIIGNKYKLHHTWI